MENGTERKSETRRKITINEHDILFNLKQDDFQSKIVIYYIALAWINVEGFISLPKKLY